MQRLIFPTSKSLGYLSNVNDVFLWDTVRDKDEGLWREYFRFDFTPVNEGRVSYIRTQIPSSIGLLAILGGIEVHNITSPFAGRHNQNTSLIAEIRGPLSTDKELKISAAEGCIAAVDGENLFIFDFAGNTNYLLNSDGFYILIGSSIFSRHSEYEKIRIGEGVAFTELKNVSLSRGNSLFENREGYGSPRPFIFVSTESKVICIRPDLQLIEFTQSEWTIVSEINCLANGSILITAGASETTMKGYLFNPENWYFTLGSNQSESHADFVTPENSIVSYGYDEIGFSPNTEMLNKAWLTVRDLDGGAERIFHENGCSLKQPGEFDTLICAGMGPSQNTVPFKTIYPVITGELVYNMIKGFSFYSGWTTANWIQRELFDEIPEEDVLKWGDSWCIGSLLSTLEGTDTEYIFEYAYYPGNYSSGAARLILENNELKFQTTLNGWADIDTEIIVSEPIRNPLTVLCGVMNYDNMSISFLSINGRLFKKEGSHVIYNEGSRLSVGRAASGANPCTNVLISNLGLSFGFNGDHLERCIQENLELIKENNSVQRLHGYKHKLIGGGDDEFGVYGVLTEENLVNFGSGVISYLNLNESGIIGEITASSMKGWRTSFNLKISETEVNPVNGNSRDEITRDVWIGASTLSFERSDYEFILGRQNFTECKFTYNKYLNGTDFIGPLLPIKELSSGAFRIEAKVKNEETREIELISGEVTVNRGSNQATTTVTSNINSTDLTVTPHIQGAYISINTDQGPEKSIWDVKVSRI